MNNLFKNLSAAVSTKLSEKDQELVDLFSNLLKDNSTTISENQGGSNFTCILQNTSKNVIIALHEDKNLINISMTNIATDLQITSTLTRKIKTAINNTKQQRFNQVWSLLGERQQTNLTEVKLQLSTI